MCYCYFRISPARAPVRQEGGAGHGEAAVREAVPPGRRLRAPLADSEDGASARRPSPAGGGEQAPGRTDMPKTCRGTHPAPGHRSLTAWRGVPATAAGAEAPRAAPGAARTPAAPGRCPSPKRSRLFVCLAGFRKRHAGLRGYWCCLLTR